MSQTKQAGSVPFPIEQQEQKDVLLMAAFSRVMLENAYDRSGLLEHISDEIARQIGDVCVIGIFSEQKSDLQVASLSHRSPIALKRIRAALKKNIYPIQHVGFAGLMLQKETYHQ